MSGYQHIGPVSDNGYVNTSQVISDYSVLKVLPGDDGFHLADPVIGNFEWWYFDVIDNQQSILLKIVAHIGTNPLKTSIFPQLALSISTKDVNESFTRKYEYTDFRGLAENCRIQIKNEFEVRVEHHSQTEYFIKVNVPDYSAELHYINESEGWKPTGERVRYSKSGKSADFMWIIPAPKARVNGNFIYKGNRYSMMNAIGYHDHNYCSVNKKRPLYLDSMVKKWYWGKCYCDDYVMIFMDTFFRTNRLRSLFVSRGNDIIHSSNNLLDLQVKNTRYDATLGTAYPSSLSLCLHDNALPIKAFIDSVKIIDKKDLLDDVPSFLRWVIKNLVARPVYYGIFARVTVEINKKEIEGYGNYEYMSFRT